jgi:hypothetical protein
MDLRHSLLAGALIFTLGAGAASADPQPTADEIIAKQVAARGGLDNLRAIKSLRFEGHLIVRGGDFKLDLVEIKARPGMVRSEASVQGLTAVQAYDGSHGWQIRPFQGRKDPEAMAPDDAKDLADDADIDGPLVDYKAKGSKVEYLGTEDVDGTPAYKLRLTEKSGDEITLFIDVDTLMTVRMRTKRILHGREDVTITDLGDYEKVAGVYFPFEMDSAPPGGGDGEKIIFDKGEANVPADESQFRMPGGPAK